MRIRAIGCGAALVVLSACGSPVEVPGDSTAATALTVLPSSQRPPSVEPSPQTPTYSIIGQAGSRPDGRPTYIVAIDPVDTSTATFKSDVKSVLTAIARTLGGASFSAKVFDDQAIANEAVTPRDALELKQRSGAHLVAWYSGGMRNGLGYPYDINWYPGAHRETPNVSRYIGSEEWKP